MLEILRRLVSICFVEYFFQCIFVAFFIPLPIFCREYCDIQSLFYGVTGIVFEDLLNVCVEATSRNEGMSGSYALSGVT